MKRRLMDFLACRACGVDFHLTVDAQTGDEITSGTIHCPSCGSRHPIIRAIPRFVEAIQGEADLRKVYADSFGHQWTTYNWLREEDEAEFFHITDLAAESLRGKVVFDAGCGGGRIARVIKQYCGELIALDYSIAVDKARELCEDAANVHFIQCDINRHPIKDSMFDLVYSHGVLHHTPDTRNSFENLPRLVKRGGLSMWLFFATLLLPYSGLIVRGEMY